MSRRWTAKAEAVMAIMSSANEAVGSPDTGSLETDLDTLLSAMRDNFGPRIVRPCSAC